MKHILTGLAGAAALAIAASHVTAQGGPPPLSAAAEQWRYYGHDEKEQRFSPLDQINRATVAKLGLAWSAEVDSDRGQEATPIMVDGVVYISTAWSLVYAFDAATGRQLWSYDPQVPRESLASACCDAVNRGVAVNGGKVFVGTLDGRLVAIDAKTGKLAWQTDTLAGAPKTMRYTITGAVRAVKDKVVIGNSGAEFGVRGFVTAYDAATGKLAWRFYLTPNPALLQTWGTAARRHPVGGLGSIGEMLIEHNHGFGQGRGSNSECSFNQAHLPHDTWLQAPCLGLSFA